MPTFAFSAGLTHPANDVERGLTSYRFDEATGQLEPVSLRTGLEDPNWLVVDVPRRLLYAVCEDKDAGQSAVAAFHLDPVTAELTPLNRQPTGGQTVCHATLTPDGRFLAVANYNGAPQPGEPDDAVRVFPVAPDGRLGEATASVAHPGHGPNPRRQTRSHGHCVLPSPDGRFIYVADLGIDRVVAYELDSEGGLTHRPGSDLVVAPGLGPRHFVFTQDGRTMFVLSEVIGTLLSVAVDPETGALTQRHSLAIAPRDGKAVQPSGILLSDDGRFVYAELRVTNEILGLEVDGQTGQLREIGRWDCGGVTPRDFTLAPSGRHLLVANQDSDQICVFERDAASGMLGRLVQRVDVGGPMAIRVVQV